MKAEAIDRTRYETVTSLERLEAWVAEAFSTGRVAFDTETTSLDPMQVRARGLLHGRRSRARLLRAARASGRQRHVRLRRPAPGADSGARGAAGAKAAAGGCLRPQDRPEPQVRQRRAGQARDRRGAARRHHAAVLRARCRPRRARPRRARRAASRTYLHELHAGARVRAGREEVGQDLRAGAARQGHGIRRRGCRRDAAPVHRPEAPPRSGAHGNRVRDAGAADGGRAGRHGARRHQGGQGDPGAAHLHVRPAHHAPGAGNLRAGRAQVQSRLSQAARRIPVRQPQAARRAQDQDRPMGDPRQPAR